MATEALGGEGPGHRRQTGPGPAVGELLSARLRSWPCGPHTKLAAGSHTPSVSWARRGPRDVPRVLDMIQSPCRSQPASLTSGEPPSQRPFEGTTATGSAPECGRVRQGPRGVFVWGQDTL